MKTQSRQARWAGRLVAVTMTGTLVAAPLLAQAAPSNHTAAQGQRNQHSNQNDKKNKGEQQWTHNSNRPDNQSNQPTRSYHPNTTNNRPGNTTYRPGTNYRPGTTYQPGGYNSNVRQNFGGVVTGNVSNNQFTMRSDSGRNITVRVQQTGQMGRISRGDRVLVAGYFQSSSVFDAQDLNLVQDR